MEAAQLTEENSNVPKVSGEEISEDVFFPGKTSAILNTVNFFRKFDEDFSGNLPWKTKNYYFPGRIHFSLESSFSEPFFIWEFFVEVFRRVTKTGVLDSLP